jgi:hypothetical protein
MLPKNNNWFFKVFLVILVSISLFTVFVKKANAGCVCNYSFCYSSGLCSGTLKTFSGKQMVGYGECTSTKQCWDTSLGRYIGWKVSRGQGR